MMNSPVNMLPSELPDYIIAIGASAGGLQQINSFFDHTPVDSVSYVIIQHLSADYKSIMASLLAKHSKLAVCEAKDNMPVEKNKVYLIPSTDYMTIVGGKLLLTEKQKTGTPHLTINTFLNSLAMDIGNNAIAVILSGSGSDGTKGVEAIKDAGGMVMVCEPNKAEYDEMPLSAINTGLVDYVLAPEQMPGIIEAYVRKKLAIAGETSESEKENIVMTEIINFIKASIPFDISEYKSSTILRRIKRRALQHNLNSLESYLQFLKSTPDEVKELAQDFLISVTSFFRDKEAFDLLQTVVIPSIIQTKSNNEEVKIWVAGCATGEEAYSLAILIKEELDRTNKNMVVKIFATDIDNIALTYAKNGLFGEDISQVLSQERLASYFIKELNGYKVKQEIRKMLIFAHHDIIKNPPYCNMDLISCRNLLIYLNQTLQKKVINMLQFGLKKGGYLVLGPSENILEKNAYIEEVNKKWRIYKVLETRRNITFDVFSPPILPGHEAITTTFAKNKELQNKHDSFKNQLNDTLISELGYVGVCVDKDNHVINTYGDISKYMLPKFFNFNLSDVLLKPLAVAFKNGSLEALKTLKKVLVSGIPIETNNIFLSVNLTIIPFHAIKPDQTLLLVLFNDVNESANASKDQAFFNEKVYASQYTQNLERELKLAKESLTEAYERLDASNENMQSFNEELLSTNEEMQSTNEEMQSVNEELHTINSEHQAKIKELSDLNDDLNNYFRSNENGQLFVDKNLLLMKFSPSAVKHINLLPTDIGRPIGNISSNIKNETLEHDALEVINTGKAITKEVEAANGKWYHMMTMPYVRERNNKIDGAIITFNDITALKLTQKELQRTNKSLKTINADLDNFVYSASHDLLGPINNIEHTISMLSERKIDFDFEINKYLDILQASVSKFKLLIRDLSVVGKIESDIYEKDPIDLSELINEIKLSIQDKIISSGAGISTDLNIPAIRFSKRNLRSILYNLISNALKFRSLERDPQIVIRTILSDGLVCLSVQDNGLGIPEKQIQNVFLQYERIHQHIEGQGIGLYLIKKIIDSAGGRVSVDSQLGKGSTFSIYFAKQ